MNVLKCRNASASVCATLALVAMTNLAQGNPSEDAKAIGGARTYVSPSYIITDADEASIFTPPGFNKPGQPLRVEGKDVGQLKLIVRDEATMKPTFCRVNVIGSDGNYYQPRENALTQYGLTLKFDTNRPDGMPRGNRRSPPIRYFGRFFYSPGECEVNVKPGPVRIEVWKGFEYEPTVVTTQVERGKTHPVEVTIRRKVPMAKHGFYSGDPHIHIPRLTPEDDEKILDLMEAEDINFGAILAFNLPPGTYEGKMDRQWTPQSLGLGRSSIRTRGAYHIISGQEFRNQTFGHLNLFMRDGIVLPGQSANNDDWPLYGDIGRETQKLGGYAFYAHGGFAQAIYADFVQGNINGVELLQFANYFGLGLDDWYHILNIGYRFPATAACDWPYCRALGDNRTYVHIDGEPDFAAWLQGAAEGRSFVTTGPLLLLEVDGKKPGDSIEKSGGPQRVTARIRVRSEVAPAGHVQLIVNGKTVKEFEVPSDQQMHHWLSLDFPIDLAESSWIAARAFSKTDAGAPNSEAHTNPVYVYLDGKAPYRQASLDQIVAGLDRQIQFHKSRKFDKKTEVLAYFDRSRDILMAIRAAGGAPSKGNPWDIARDEHAMLNQPGATTHSDEELKDFLKPIPRLSQEEALKSIETTDGFHMEVVASEPLVCDPVAAEFDENNQLYVCEMRDYPYKPKPGDKPLGTVRLLRDADNDGVFDQSHVFADGLLWASGIVPWKGGVFVASAPDIWYLKDTDGDFKADVREKVFTGFGTQNQQAMLNNLKYGFDHKIYGSTGPNGGEVHSGDGGTAKSVSVKGRDFRFDPETLQFETVTGTIQFGNTFDDWGNRFVCSQSQPLLQVVLPQHYLARNPYLPVPSAIFDLAGYSVPVFRISPTERWRQIRSNRLISQNIRDAQNADVSQYVIDAAAGVTVYRGAAYPKQYYGNVFIGEAQNNLVHRRVLTPDGVTFKSQRADENTEFVRSSDNWFRPVNFVNAPDGTLYVLDMSREIIESNNIPVDVAKHLDLTRGRDQGRIYRIAPSGFRATKPPRLGSASAAELVAALENPNGWWRDAAHRLIHERQDRTCVPAIRALITQSSVPQARMLALWSLEGLGALTADDVETALRDPLPPIREHAIRLAESRMDSSPRLFEQLLSLESDPDARVCFQLAFTLGESDDVRTVPVLANILRKHASDPWIRTAVLSSAAMTADRLFAELMHDSAFATSKRGTEILSELAQTVGAQGKADEMFRVIEVISEQNSAIGNDGSTIILGLGKGLKQSGAALPDSSKLSQTGAEFINQLISRAESSVMDRTLPVKERQQAIEILSCLEFEKSRQMLFQLLEPGEAQEIQLAALNAIADYDNGEIVPSVIAGWQQYLPAVRTRVIRLLLSRDGWAKEYLAAVEDGRATAAEIDPTERTRLLEHHDDMIRSAAQKLFSSSPRESVIAEYQTVLQLHGDSSRGKLVYQRECSACHRIGDQGYAVGPDLASSPSRNPEALLTNVLDPNRAVDPANLQYVIIDNSGRIFGGKIETDTATSITLTSGQGVHDTILRSNIDVIESTGRSLMPEGFEKTISKEEMADLIAFLNELSGGPEDSRATMVGGTRPGSVEP